MRAGGPSLFLFFTQYRPTRHTLFAALFSLLFAAATGLLAAPPAQAQSNADDSIHTEDQAADSAQARRFRLAENYLRAGQHERAIALLEDLYDESPGTHVFYNKLKEAYENVKRYDEAIALVDDRLDRNPIPVRFSEKARLLYLKGDEEAAFDTWDEAIATAPDQQSTYRVVYQALTDVRRFDRAIDVLERGREHLGASDAFRTELAYLYSLAGRHDRAIEEYLALLADNERRLGFVRSRLNTFVEQDDALQASVDAVQSAVRETPMNLAYRELLAWLHMEAEDYRAAFDVYRAVDRLQQEQGRRLLAFAHQAADAQAYDVALDAYDELLSRYPDAPSAPEARHSLGDMHRRWAEMIDGRAASDDSNGTAASHYEAAADAYRTYLQDYPNRDAYPTVLQKLGRLQQDVFHELDAAEQTFQEVVERYPDSEAADEARYDLGRIALMRGNLDEAQLAFSRLAERLRTGDLAEKARYELALLHFYQGAFESALAQVKRTNTNTETDVANDAIELKVLLLQNRGPDSLDTPLRHYADAERLQRQRRYDQALATLDTLLASYNQHAIADDAHFLRGTVLRAQDRTEAAVETFMEIPRLFPRSPLADQSLFQAAELQEQSLDEPAAALDTYAQLLEEHPNSLLAEKARARIRALRQGMSS